MCIKLHLNVFYSAQLSLIVFTQELSRPAIPRTCDLLQSQSLDASSFLEQCFEAGPEVLLNEEVVKLIWAHLARLSSDDTRLLVTRQILLYLQTEISNWKVCVKRCLEDTVVRAAALKWQTVVWVRTVERSNPDRPALEHPSNIKCCTKYQYNWLYHERQ